MPLYQTRCLSCDAEDTIFRKIVDRNDLPGCRVCGGAVQREIVAPMILREFEPYVSPASGKVVGSRAQRREDLLQTNSIEYEPGLKEQIARKNDEIWEEKMQKLDAHVDNVVCALNTSGRFDDATGN